MKYNYLKLVSLSLKRISKHISLYHIHTHKHICTIKNLHQQIANLILNASDIQFSIYLSYKIEMSNVKYLFKNLSSKCVVPKCYTFKRCTASIQRLSYETLLKYL